MIGYLNSIFFIFIGKASLALSDHSLYLMYLVSPSMWSVNENHGVLSFEIKGCYFSHDEVYIFFYQEKQCQIETFKRHPLALISLINRQPIKAELSKAQKNPVYGYTLKFRDATLINELDEFSFTLYCSISEANFVGNLFAPLAISSIKRNLESWLSEFVKSSICDTAHLNAVRQTTKLTVRSSRINNLEPSKRSHSEMWAFYLRWWILFAFFGDAERSVANQRPLKLLDWLDSTCTPGFQFQNWCDISKVETKSCYVTSSFRLSSALNES